MNRIRKFALSPVSTEVRHCIFENTVELARIYNSVAVIDVPQAWQYLGESWCKKIKTVLRHNVRNITKKKRVAEDEYLPWALHPLWRTSRACKTLGDCSSSEHVCETDTGPRRSGNTKERQWRALVCRCQIDWMNRSLKYFLDTHCVAYVPQTNPSTS